MLYDNDLHQYRCYQYLLYRLFLLVFPEFLECLENRLLLVVQLHLERQLRLERFGREVDSMIRDGYRCGKFRNSMVEELADTANPTAKMAFWKATMAKNPINVPTVAQHTVTDEAHESMDIKAATARAVHEAAGDLTKFKSLFAKYSGQKA